MKHFSLFLFISGLLFTFHISAQEPLIGEVSAWSLNVRAQPGTRAPEIAELSQGTQVYIQGRPDCIDPLWVYVTTQDGSISGWVAVRYLYYPDGFRAWYWQLPVMYTGCFEYPQPIQIQGQVIAWVNIRYPINLRAEPNRASTLMRTVPERTLLAVHGRTDFVDCSPGYLSERCGRWVYVTILDTGESGWLLDRNRQEGNALIDLQYPHCFDRDTLPFLPPTASPPLPPTVEPVPILTVTAEPGVRVRHYTFAAAPIVTRLLEPQAVTVIGRNLNARWFKIDLGGQVGWVGFGSLQLPPEYYRLPILTSHDGLSIAGRWARDWLAPESYNCQ